jgi:radical SAM enzyme (TIGR01210 family)
VLAACPAAERGRVRRLAVYNSGSVLDQRTLPKVALWYLCEQTGAFPGLREVCLDTRAEFVTEQGLDDLKKRLKGAQLSLAVGYETQDERIRNHILGKALSEGTFQRTAALLAAQGVRLKAYVMVKPEPAASERDAIEEAVLTLRHLSETGRRLGLQVEVHLSPTFVARGSLLERLFLGRHYSPPTLWSVLEVVSRLEGQGLPIQIGLDAEGLAAEGGTARNCGRCDELVRQALVEFSGTQDYSRLKSLDCACRARG